MKTIKLFLEFMTMALGSILAGFSIAAILHYVSFGVWGYGLGKEAIEMALLEGGLTGILAAIPTGAVIYYWILKRFVTPKEVAIILLGSLVGGFVIAIANPVISAILAPIWTIGVSVWVKRRRGSDQMLSSL